MGYTTDFDGKFDLDKPLTEAHRAYLVKFNETRRMRRNPSLTSKRADPVREAVGLPVGPEGAYFVGEGGYAGQDNGPDVTDHNEAPEGQPGLWCQWVPNEDGTAIVWDGGEKFYFYTEWLQYLIHNFLAPWGYALNGQVEWNGEEPGDQGVIHVRDNEVRAVYDEIVRPDPWE